LIQATSRRLGAENSWVEANMEFVEAISAFEGRIRIKKVDAHVAIGISSQREAYGGTIGDRRTALPLIPHPMIQRS